MQEEHAMHIAGLPDTGSGGGSSASGRVRPRMRRVARAARACAHGAMSHAALPPPGADAIGPA